MAYSDFVRFKQDAWEVHHGLKNAIQMKLVKCIPNESIASTIISFFSQALYFRYVCFFEPEFMNSWRVLCTPVVGYPESNTF